MSGAINLSQNRNSKPRLDPDAPPTMSSLLNESMTELLNLQGQINEQNHLRINQKNVYINPNNFVEMKNGVHTDPIENTPHIVY